MDARMVKRGSQILRDSELLGAADMKREVLDEDDEATLGWVEAFPKSETDGAGNRLLHGDVFDGGELLETADYIVIDKEMAFVIPLINVSHQAALIQCHHHIGTSAVNFGSQWPSQSHLQCRW